MNDLYLIGEVGYEITLTDVINKVNNSDKKKPLNINIHSQGGSVYEGLAIYNYLKSLKQEVNTHSSGLVASIASIFFLAGKNRTINNTDNFLIHLPSGMSMGNAKDFEKTAKELRDIENKLATIYENETNLTKDEALELMKNDEFLNVDFLLEKGFVNEIIKFQAVAKYDSNFNNDMSEQLTKTEALSWFEKLENLLKGTPKETAIVNKIVQDANGVEIDFFKLESDAEIVEGAEATVENVKASGEYTMPDGQVYSFDNGILTTISEKVEEEVVEENAELEALKSEFDSLKASFDEKELELTTIKAELETKNNLVNEIQTEFTELKNQVSSNFEHENKVEIKKEEKTEIQSRTNFKLKGK